MGRTGRCVHVFRMGNELKAFGKDNVMAEYITVLLGAVDPCWISNSS